MPLCRHELDVLRSLHVQKDQEFSVLQNTLEAFTFHTKCPAGHCNPKHQISTRGYWDHFGYKTKKAFFIGIIEILLV
jgi:hypothetical protein